MLCFWSTSQTKTWFKQMCCWLICYICFKLLIADSNNFSEELSTLIGLESSSYEHNPIFFHEYVLRKKYESSPFPPPDSFPSKQQHHWTTTVVISHIQNWILDSCKMCVWALFIGYEEFGNSSFCWFLVAAF